jgi:DNA adenine methylase
VLGDVNEALIEAFQTVRSAPEEVAHAIWRFSNNAECYYRVRGSVPRTTVGRAARFIYLNRTAWGGIYRLNGDGNFNVPFGFSGRTICRKELLVAASAALSGTTFVAADFATTIGGAVEGDVVYADPPYVGQALGREESFTRYSYPPFHWHDQERLARVASAAAERGVAVFVTTRAGVGVEDLYPGWQTMPLRRRQRVTRDIERRLDYRETLICNR